jgi:hypothetical protein
MSLNVELVDSNLPVLIGIKPQQVRDLFENKAMMLKTPN